VTTIREYFDSGELGIALSYLRLHKGNVPMCCFRIQKNKITCGYVKEWLSKEEFTKKCKKCQEYMIKYFRELGYWTS